MEQMRGFFKFRLNRFRLVNMFIKPASQRPNRFIHLYRQSDLTVSVHHRVDDQISHHSINSAGMAQANNS